MTPLWRNATVIAGTALAAVTALAGESPNGLYVAADLGRTTVQLRNDALARQLTAAGFGFSDISADKSDGAWRATLGYRFSAHFGVEASIAPAGDVSQQTELNSFAGSPIPPTPLTIRYQSENTFTISALGIVPVGAFAVDGRLGGYTTRITAKGSAPSIGLVIDESTRARGWLVGAGASYDIGKSASLRVGFQRLKNVGNDGRIPKSDVDFFSLGLLYRLSNRP